MPTYDPRFWDWWTGEDTGKLYVQRYDGPEMRRVFSSKEWMWARTMNGGLKIVRRHCREPFERCPLCLAKFHFEEMLKSITGDRVCFRCADDPRLLKRAGMVV